LWFCAFLRLRLCGGFLRLRLWQKALQNKFVFFDFAMFFCSKIVAQIIQICKHTTAVFSPHASTGRKFTKI